MITLLSPPIPWVPSLLPFLPRFRTWAAKNPHVSSVITGATREEQVRGEKEGVQPL